MSEITPEVSMVDTLRHIADDHPCCGGSLLVAAAHIEALEKATARAERSHSMSVEEDLERMDKVIEYWKNLAERLHARIEELEKLASHEAHCACVPTLEARIEALEKAVAEAYWKGHGDGRIWGKKPMAAEAFEIGGLAIYAALAAKPK
jgi:hypothetical protein